jgi:FAD/FMN-containing dehydrogenase
MRTRRQFIKESVVSGAALALMPTRRHLNVDATPEVDPARIRKFRSSLKGRLILPGEKDYETARRVMTWNPLTDKRPAMIAQCARKEDVVRCVEFAHRHNLPVAVRSGGHSYLGWGTCDDGLVIDLSLMRETSIDASKRVARAGGGVLAYNLVARAGRHRLAPVTGDCPTVGVSGLTLGGGLGWLSGKHGAVCDNLISAELVTADGRTLVASEDRNPDLFWAIRGGGGNFGIATSFEYRLHSVGEVLAGGYVYRLSDARAVLRFYRDFMATAPDELAALTYLVVANDRWLTLIVCYSGDVKRGETLLRPLRTIANPVRDTVQARPYVETFTMPPWGETIPTAYSSTKGCYLRELSDDVIDIALDRFARTSLPGSAMGFDHYMHGAVCRTAPEATAFELRAPGALHVWVVSGWREASEAVRAMAWVDDTWNALQPYSGGRTYANFLSTEGEAAVKAAFGANYPRLAVIKRKYDPTNFFRRNQNIRPAES